MAILPTNSFDYAKRLERRQQAQPDEAQGDRILRAVEDMEREDFAQSLRDAPDPDQIARNERLARQTGESPAEIQGREDEVEKSLSRGRLVALSAGMPGLQNYFLMRPRAAAMAQDDGDALSTISQSIADLRKVPARVFGSGVNRAGSMLLDAQKSLRDVNDFLTTPVRVPVEAAFAAIARETGIEGLDPERQRKEREARYRRDKQAYADRAARIAAENRGSNYVTEGLLAGTESVPLTALAIATRNPAAASTVFGGVVGSSSYQDARDQGLGVGQSLRYGAVQGGIEAGTELLPAATLIDLIARRTPFGKAFVRELGQEMGGEQVATVLQDLNDFATLPENRGKTMGDYLVERPQAALDTALGTVGSVSVTTGTIAAGQRAADITVRMRETFGDRDRARAEARFLQKLSESAEASKLRQRSPETFRELMREMLADSDAERVYIPGSAIRAFQQSDEYDAGNDPFADRNVDEAAATGGDVIMSTEELLDRVFGTPAWQAVKDDVRLTGGGMSKREADTFDEAMDEIAAEMGEQMRAQDEAQRSQMTVREQLTERVATMFGQSYAVDAARTVAEVAVSRAQSRAARLGQELTGAEFDNLDVRQVMPESLAAMRAADQVDVVINAMRKNASPEIGEGGTLLEFIRARGGINDPGGDLAAIGVPARLLRETNPDQGTLAGLSGAGDYGIDSTLRAAIEDGFFPELANVENEAGPSTLDTQVLLNALEQEVAGSLIYRTTREDPARAAAAELRTLIEEAGLDPDSMTDDEIRAEIERLDAAGRSYEQADSKTRWQADVSAFRAGQLAPGAQMQLGRLSPPYRDLGMKGVLRMHAGKLRKVLDKHDKLPNRVIETLPAYLADPVAIIPGAANADRTLVVLNDQAEDGSPIFASIQPDDTRGDNMLITLFVADQNGAERVRRALSQALSRNQKVYLRDGLAGASSKTEASEAFLLNGPVTINSPGKATRYVRSRADIVKKYRSFGQSANGRIIMDGAQRTIELFESRNLSTAIHELGHMWLEELRIDASLPDAPTQVRRDWETMQGWFTKLGHPVDGNAPIPTEAHEYFARGIERYFMEGKAPSSALRTVFETVRQWMIGVYRTVARLDAPITPEIREVFDRMLATDEEIEAQRERQSLKALFDQAPDGMSAEEFEAYQAEVNDARAEVSGKLLDKAMAAVRRREQKRYREIRKDIRQAETERIDEAPLFKAMRLMKEQRISKDWLVDNYGVDATDMLPVRVPPLWADGGVDPQIVAELSGYSSAREMIEALMGAQSAHRQAREGGDKRSLRERAIDIATEEEFARRYGDPLNDGSIEREAAAEVHSERQGELIAAEVRFLSRTAGRRPTPYSLAREWARGKIRGGVIAEEAMPAAIQRYTRNAARAAKTAEQAMATQDREEAFRQKQFQMMNSALVAEAKLALDEVESARKRLKKIADAKTRKSVDQDYLEQAHALLEAVELRERSQASINRAGQWSQWAEAREAEGFDVVAPREFEALIGRTNWTRLTVNDLLTLDEQVKQILHLGRLKQTLIDNQERRAFEEAVGEAEAAGDNIGRKPPKGSFVDPSWWENTKAQLHAFDASLLRMEQVFDWLDEGKSDGVFNRIVFRPIAEAQAEQRAMIEQYHTKLKAAARKLDQATVRSWADKVTLDLIDPETGLPAEFQRKRLIAMALNWGNAGNRQRLADGYGWNERAVEAALMDNLTEQEWRYVQEVWDIIGELWPSIEKMERAINGIAPPKIEPAEVVTPFGTFAGGYYPAIYDSRFDYTAEEREAKKSDLFSANYIRASTRASSTKERADQVARPILLELGVINRHLGEVIHDVTHREPVMNAHKFLNDRRVKRMIDETLGAEIRKQMQPWLNYIANSWAAERAGNEGIGRFMGKLRANTTVVGMGWRFTTMLTQIAGYSNSFEKVGVRWVSPQIAKFQAQMMGSVGKLATFQGVQMPEMMAFALERSDELRFRLDTLDRDIRLEMDRLQSKGGRTRDGLTAAKRFAFHGIGYMDRLVSVPTWMGAYNKAIANGLDDKAAAYEADKAIRLSQGAGAPKDLAAVSRGTGRWGEAFKLLTMFYTYLSSVYSRQRNLGRDVKRAGVRDIPNLMARAWWLIVVPPLLAEILSGRGPDEDEEWGWWAFQKMLSQSLGAIPIVRDLTDPMFDGFAGRPGFDYRLSPLQGVGASAVNVARDAGKAIEGDEPTRPVRNTLEFVGYTTGMVPGQVAASAQFLVDVGDGEADPETAEDWYTGMTKGKLPEE